MTTSTTSLPVPDAPLIVPPVTTVRLGERLRRLAIPVLAVFTAVLIGSVLILIVGLDPIKAYTALLQGAFGSDVGLSRTLVKMTPLILSGLAVAVAFKAGLFNIGAQGQLMIGSLLAAWAGFGISGLPPVIHITIALLAGIIGGALWGAIPGILKAYTGAHEVISTIMLNYIAGLLLEWVVTPISATSAAGPLAACNKIGSCATGKTPPILASAWLPALYKSPIPDVETIHLGIVIGIGVALLMYIVIYKTTFGFRLRMVGLNAGAARYSGVNVARMTVIAMVIAGGLAGLAGAIQTQGVSHDFEINLNQNIGFDSIAVALLAANNPIAIIPSAFLFGALEAGSTQMQTVSHVPNDLISVIQALILMFIAADQIIRQVYRIRGPGGSSSIRLSSGWGGL